MPQFLLLQRLALAVVVGLLGGGLVRFVAVDWPVWQALLLIAAWGMAGIYSVRLLVPGEEH